MSDTVKVIPKINSSGDVELFLPEFDVNPGHIMCWAHVGQHGEAANTYYHEQRNPRTDAEEQAVREAMQEYADYYKCSVIRRKRVQWRRR